jgi:hypothetical protein
LSIDLKFGPNQTTIPTGSMLRFDRQLTICGLLKTGAECHFDALAG